MGKFYGRVWYGLSEEREDYPGSYRMVLKPRAYIGDITRNSRRLETGDKVNGEIVVNNVISIVADAYAMDNFAFIKCVEWMGVKWSVQTAEVKSPRLVLTLGGVYNGQED